MYTDLVCWNFPGCWREGDLVYPYMAGTHKSTSLCWATLCERGGTSSTHSQADYNLTLSSPPACAEPQGRWLKVRAWGLLALSWAYMLNSAYVHVHLDSKEYLGAFQAFTDVSLPNFSFYWLIDRLLSTELPQLLPIALSNLKVQKLPLIVADAHHWVKGCSAGWTPNEVKWRQPHEWVSQGVTRGIKTCQLGEEVLKDLQTHSSRCSGCQAAGLHHDCGPLVFKPTRGLGVRMWG